MGDGSEYPEIGLRSPGFLERLRTTGHDPEDEQKRGESRRQMLIQMQNRGAQNSSEPALKTIPLQNVDALTASKIQKGECLIKRDQQWVYVKDGREVPSNIQGYLTSIFDTFNQPIINLAEFHENTSGKYSNILKSQLT